MDNLLGVGNGPLNYVLVLAVYAALFLVMRHAHQSVELNFRRTYWTLYFGWAVSVFFGNYLFYKIGIMSFLPWVDNFLHTFIWIGLCLGFLYAGSYFKAFWEQFALFAIFSFLVKWAEHQILGTWEFGHFFFIQGNIAYIVGWSLMDGLYPLLSAIGLKFISRFMEGIIVP
jgi:hypothetical protein